MTDHHDRNLKLREENQELAGKLKKFIEQYEVREKVCILYICSDFENVYRTAQSQQGDVFTLKVKMNVKKKKSIMKFIRGHIYIYIEKVLITVQSL